MEDFRHMYAKNINEAEQFECAGIQFGMMVPRDVTGSLEVVWERLKPFESTPVDRHSSFDQLFVILKGTGEVTVGEQKYHIKPSTVVLIPQGVLHSIRCISEEGLEYYFVNVWKTGIPAAESDWRAAYSSIHDRRTAVQSVGADEVPPTRQ
jgi:mannose-6-phosphate isomerase-like protein (cupin superfamily)